MNGEKTLIRRAYRSDQAEKSSAAGRYKINE